MKKWSTVLCILGGLLVSTATLSAADGVDAKAGVQSSTTATVSGADGLQSTKAPAGQAALVKDKAQLKQQSRERSNALPAGLSNMTAVQAPAVSQKLDLSGARATLTIEIFTDDYPDETTWEVVEYPSGAVVGSGGPYANANTLHTENVTINDTGCYHFHIMDAYGDGICCEYGNGYYNVYLNSVLQCNGGDFASEDWCPCIGTCPPDCGLEYACCVGNTCHTVANQAECDGMSGTYYPGSLCATFVCPQSCPANVCFAQITDNGSGSWSAGTSGETTAFNYYLFENFPQINGDICDIHWWGLLLYYNNGWFACPTPNAVQFEIQFRAPAAQPDPWATPVCSYTPVTPTVTELGAAFNGNHLYYFEVPTLTPCCSMPNGGWVSIKSLPNNDDCVFLWMSSGNGNSYQWEFGSLEVTDTGYNRGLCLTGPNCSPVGACCVGEVCSYVSEAVCAGMSGAYQGDFVPCDPNPCQLGCPDCPPNTIWGQNGMSCDESWSAGTSAVFPGGDPNYVVYESVPQLPCEICDIHWYGLLLQYNSGWFLCPAPNGLGYTIKFYADNSGTPGTELCSYSVFPTPTSCDLCNDTFPLYYMDANLMPCCFGLLTQPGWVSIQSQEDISNLCVFLWFSARCGDSSSLQWDGTTMTTTAYDRGVCLTGPCGGPGACCPGDGTCIVTTADLCCNGGGVFLGASTVCDPNPCPQPTVPVCPANTLYGQPAYACADNWTAVTSAGNVGAGYRAYDNFANVTGDICDLHWWGLSLRWSGSWQVCDPVGMQFEVKFYLDNNNLPAYTTPVCTYTLAPTITLLDPNCSGRELWQFESALTPCCTLANGWLSIRSNTSTNSCSFLWFGSAYGDGRCLQQTGTAWPPTERTHDLGFCLTGNPTVGACCLPDGSCVDGQTAYDCETGQGGVYQGDNTLCANVQCPQPLIPVCPANTMVAQPAMACYQDWTATTTDATLGYVAYDNFAGATNDICDVHWWGLSLAWSAGWTLCDPAGMVVEIKFYNDNGMNEPDTANPVCTYQVAPTIAQFDTCGTLPYWEFHADLSPCCTLATGWLSIQSTSGCVLLWMSSAVGDALSYQWDGTALVANAYDLGWCLTDAGGPQVCPGDSNCDGFRSWRDIDFFVAAQNDNVAAWTAMFPPPGPTCDFANNDVNQDGTVNWRDIDPLVAVMNTPCP